MHRMILSVILLLYALRGIATAAGGADVVGAACVPDPSTYFCGYVATNGGVTFGGLSFCTFYPYVNFYCSVPNASQMSAPTTLTISYTDDTGTADNEVYVTYYKMNKATGVLTAVANVITSSGCTTGSFRTCSASFTDTFAPATYRYFIAVTLERTSNAPTEIFYGASLR